MDLMPRIDTASGAIIRPIAEYDRREEIGNEEEDEEEEKSGGLSP
jgi:hypothetical protein